MSWDTLIKNGLVFDGRGGAPVECDVAIENAKVATVGKDLGGSPEDGRLQVHLSSPPALRHRASLVCLGRERRRISRLTQVPAEFWGVSDTLGTIEPGLQADLTLIDPEALRAYDSDANTTFGYREAVAAEQMLNRSDGVVTDVWISGKPA